MSFCYISHSLFFLYISWGLGTVVAKSMWLTHIQNLLWSLCSSLPLPLSLTLYVTVYLSRPSLSLFTRLIEHEASQVYTISNSLEQRFSHLSKPVNCTVKRSTYEGLVWWLLSFSHANSQTSNELVPQVFPKLNPHYNSSCVLVWIPWRSVC